uniref:leucyl/phenylalanyl-tRNA--protein transferase n=1 Tax=Ningiella ruwaisensis TaxID=2364274 RepID=UPI0010A03A31|nr:leucyl/phenylalanyl-tRNA--protein transferase [Ningiella ruwaisensis]
MLELFKLDDSLNFPSAEFALDEPNGLLAFGGDLSVRRLVQAYSNGIFPWFSEGEPLLWWSPDPRGVIFTDDFKPSRSLRKSVRKFGYTATMDNAFSSVIAACAKVPRRDIYHGNKAYSNSTWITDDMLRAYREMHGAGYAHSVEVWNSKGELVGGLYGVTIGQLFCGESMFHIQTDASKAAFWALAHYMASNKLPLIDCQMLNPHLETLGCIAVSRQEFLDTLSRLKYRSNETPGKSGLQKSYWRKLQLELQELAQ